MIDNLRLFGVQMACTGGAGGLAKTAVAPLERVKLLMQVNGMRTGALQGQPSAPLKLSQTLSKLWALEGGLRALYRGNGVNVLRQVPDIAFKFLLYDQLKMVFAPPEGSPLGIPEKLATGAAAGMARTLLFYPLDLCRMRMTADRTPADQPRPYGRIWSCLQTTYQQEGVRACYRGCLASVASVVPYMSISFAAYDELRSVIPDDKLSRSQLWHPMAKMAAGGAAAVLAQTVTYPIDTLRRRMQVNGAMGYTAADGRPLYRGYLDCFSQMVVKEGFRSFFRGWQVSVLKIMPGAAVQFMTYDFFKYLATVVDPAATVQSFSRGA